MVLKDSLWTGNQYYKQMLCSNKPCHCNWGYLRTRDSAVITSFDNMARLLRTNKATIKLANCTVH